MRAPSNRISTLLAVALFVACGPDRYVPAPFVNRDATLFTLNDGASGVTEVVNNIINVTAASREPQVLKAEYQAGFVLGRLQASAIVQAREDALTGYTAASAFGPSRSRIADVLLSNFDFFIDHLHANRESLAAQRLTRLLFRLLGMYHGATRADPASLDFSGDWLPASSTFSSEELKLNSGGPLSFMDLYFINAIPDLADVLFNNSQTGEPAASTQPGQCSAFVKRTGAEVLMAHSTWAGFRVRPLAVTVDVNGDRMTINAVQPGNIGSGSDFGYNGKGIVFNETSFQYGPTPARVQSIWSFWRSAAAEQFAGSIDEFVDLMLLDNSGTYLSGYAIVDVKTREMALLEMAASASVLFRSTGGDYTVVTWPAGLSTEFDDVMLTGDSIAQYNYPASIHIRNALGGTPKYWETRREQFQQLLPDVTDLETAKAAITYYDPAKPDSIYGRLDLAGFPQPFGAVDAKVVSVAMVQDFMGLAGVPDVSAPTTGFWMRYGSAYDADGWPFVWSRYEWQVWNSPSVGSPCSGSSWCGRGHAGVPDQVDGVFTRLNLHLR